MVTQKYEEVLLGFDVRVMWDLTDWEWAWTSDRRENFLLRQDVERPFSTDTMVWPSVFDHDEKLTAPDWHGIRQVLYFIFGIITRRLQTKL